MTTNVAQVAIQIERLVQFAIERQLLAPLDIHFARNALLDLFRIPEPAAHQPASEAARPVELLEPLLDYGAEMGLIAENTTTFRDLLDARIMGMLMARPAEVAKQFAETVATQGIEQATTQFYALNIDSNYIRMDRIRKNMYWQYESTSGNLEITINLSKPEKDPREIALLKNAVKSNYPACLLCAENVGYAGRLDHPARQNLRVLPLTLDGDQWYFQYSPYVYYNEHSIVFRHEHVPMKISGQTFKRLLDFVEQFPHYFIGSNADLPIVGGSILNHDHFQAGRHTFAMANATEDAYFTAPHHADVSVATIEWPMSVIRLRSDKKEQVLAVAEHILAAWRTYSDASVDVLCSTVDEDGSIIPHHTVTPIARLTAAGEYEMDLVLRNNRTSDEHPDGIFHPHQHLHHIKRENIGLIEVMGLAVLPGRLKDDLEVIADYLSGQVAEVQLPQHADWIADIVQRHGLQLTKEQATTVVRQEVGAKFHDVLQCAGVFKRDVSGQRAFMKFLTTSGFTARS